MRECRPSCCVLWPLASQSQHSAWVRPQARRPSGWRPARANAGWSVSFWRTVRSGSCGRSAYSFLSGCTMCAWPLVTAPLAYTSVLPPELWPILTPGPQVVNVHVQRLTKLGYFGVGLATALPLVILPLVLQPAAEQGKPWGQRFWVKSQVQTSVCRVVCVLIGGIAINHGMICGTNKECMHQCSLVRAGLDRCVQLRGQLSLDALLFSAAGCRLHLSVLAPQQRATPLKSRHPAVLWPAISACTAQLSVCLPVPSLSLTSVQILCRCPSLCTS